MNAEVIELNLITKLDLDPDRLLQKAMGRLDEVLILGFDKEGNEYFAASKADASASIYLCERAKHRLMRMLDEMSEE